MYICAVSTVSVISQMILHFAFCMCHSFVIDPYYDNYIDGIRTFQVGAWNQIHEYRIESEFLESGLVFISLNKYLSIC